MDISIDLSTLFLLFDCLDYVSPAVLPNDFLIIYFGSSLVFKIDDVLVFWSLTSFTVLPFTCFVLPDGFNFMDYCLMRLVLLILFSDFSRFPELSLLIFRKFFRDALRDWFILIRPGDEDLSREISTALFKWTFIVPVLLVLITSFFDFWILILRLDVLF